MEMYNPIIAAFINSVLVLLVVQGLKSLIPVMRESIPWLIPILAGAIGPAVAAGQNALFAWLGIPIDLSAITAIFSGGTAVAIHQLGRQIEKSRSTGVPAAKPSGRSSIHCIFLLMLMMIFALTLSGCATLGIGGGTTSFDKLTQDEQARVVVSAVQNGSDLLFDVGRGVMIIKPEYKEAWKLAVVPSFDSLNKILLDLETKGAAGQKIDVPAVLITIQGRIAEIVSLIAQYGNIGKTAGSKPTPDDYALIAILGISTATVAWNDIVAAMSGQISTWEVIKARNGILQMKIDPELR